MNPALDHRSRPGLARVLHGRNLAGARVDPREAVRETRRGIPGDLHPHPVMPANGRRRLDPGQPRTRKRQLCRMDRLRRRDHLAAVSFIASQETQNIGRNTNKVWLEAIYNGDLQNELPLFSAQLQKRDLAAMIAATDLIDDSEKISFEQGLSKERQVIGRLFRRASARHRISSS